MRNFLLTFSAQMRILFNKQGARALHGTINLICDKEDKMQRIVKNLYNFITDKQGALVLEKHGIV